jgi:hypothetical protein
MSLTAEPPRAIEVFYSYAHEDERFRKILETHLSNLRLRGLISDWNDREIIAGQEWAQEINTHLKTAQIILLLISPDFMASNYINTTEMKRAMERHEAGEARVIPIILRPVDWKGTPFDKLQMLPTNAKPVTEWPNRDRAFMNIARGIRKAVEELNTSFLKESFPPVAPTQTALASSQPPRPSTKAPSLIESQQQAESDALTDISVQPNTMVSSSEKLVQQTTNPVGQQRLEPMIPQSMTSAQEPKDQLRDIGDTRDIDQLYHEPSVAFEKEKNQPKEFHSGTSPLTLSQSNVSTPLPDQYWRYRSDAGNSNTPSSIPIAFPNGRHAMLVETYPNTTANEIISLLKLDKHKAVILILGETDIPDADSRARLLQLFSRGLARAVAENDVLIIDRGIESEVMTGLGKALLGRANNMQLLGIANESELNIPGATPEQASNAKLPAIANGSQVTNNADSANGRKMLESYHTHFVAVKSASSDSEIDQKYALAEALSEGPILTVLVNDSPLARDEVVRSLRKGWPVLVITGSGGFADTIQQAWQAKQDYIVALSKWNQSSSKGIKPVPPFVPDPVLAEAIAYGDLHFFSITDTPENLERRIDLRLKANSILTEVLEQQRVYSADARQHQSVFRLQQNWILILGVLIVALAALTAFSKQMLWNVPIQVGSIKVNFPNDVLYFVLISLPVVLTLLIAGANRSNAGNKWIARRAAAEAFKREVFRYRTHTGIYSDGIVIQNGTTREATLARMTEAISRQWVEGSLDILSSLVKLHPDVLNDHESG